MRPSVTTILLSLLSLLNLCIGCGDDFAAPSLVSDLRLLAVQADQPFARAGDQVKLRALAHDPEQRTLTWAWGTCSADASSLALDCLRATSFESLTIAENRTEHTLLVPAEAQTYLGVVVAVCPGAIVRGDSYGVPITCVDGSGRALPLTEFELGVKRIFVRDPALNTNPTFSEVLWDGAPWPEQEVKLSTCRRTENVTCVAWTEHAIELRAPGAAEQSVDRDGAPFEELAVVQFYATGGEFENDLRNAAEARTTWEAHAEDSGELVTLWFVVRDDRGGVSWSTRQVRVP